MVSFDVVSLFTSIPQALAVETLSDLLRQNYDEGDGQPTAQDLIELMGHCLKTFFTFEGITYEQIKGTPMGSPISGLIAEAVLQKLEKRLFGEYKPKFWARYVDDTFVIIDQDKISYYEELLNSIGLDVYRLLCQPPHQFTSPLSGFTDILDGGQSRRGTIGAANYHRGRRRWVEFRSR
nr:unnamed protein product [Spirometra erinaceieuropaei]